MSIMLMIRLPENRQFTYRIGEQEPCAKRRAGAPQLRARRAIHALAWCAVRRGGVGAWRAASGRFAGMRRDMAGHAPDRGATRRAATIGRSKARHTAGIDARACAGARAFERPDVAASGQARVRRGPIRMRGRRAEAAARSFFGVDAKSRAPVGHLERVAAA
ncbi:hypothetical protein, partial [Burkholderia thailandensis]|uniref:hypothetical protein n=1 Tax=Burkholderia thailandensis TaxID=57975 RepID=UPI0012FE616F